MFVLLSSALAAPLGEVEAERRALLPRRLNRNKYKQTTKVVPLWSAATDSRTRAPTLLTGDLLRGETEEDESDAVSVCYVTLNHCVHTQYIYLELSWENYV